MTSYQREVIERLTRIETVVSNHLRHHQYVYWPLLMGVLWLIVRG